MDERDLLRAGTSSGVSCPWCSNAVPAGATACPSCGATVAAAADEDDEPELPGLTTIDPSIAALANRVGKKRARGAGIAAWLSGEPSDVRAVPTTPGAAPALTGEVAFEPPSEEVRREMLRLELASRRHELESSIMPDVPDEDRSVERR